MHLVLIEGDAEVVAYEPTPETVTGDRNARQPRGDLLASKIKSSIDLGVLYVWTHFPRTGWTRMCDLSFARRPITAEGTFRSRFRTQDGRSASH